MAVVVLSCLLVGAEFYVILNAVDLSRYKGFSPEWHWLFWSQFLIPSTAMICVRILQKTSSRMRAAFLSALAGPIIGLLHVFNYIGMKNALLGAKGEWMQSESSGFHVLFLGPPAMFFGLLAGIPLAIALWSGFHARVKTHNQAL